MNQLLPIIRRVRRPLVLVDVPPVRVGSVEPPPVNAEGGTQGGVTPPVWENATTTHPTSAAAVAVPRQTNDGQTVARRKAR
ncbi:MAG TPA: hypothetical protein VFV96_11830 [Verrucomicrobiae bacterium]|nr:hypothetical protein [Verrucomicrobiae bacterium]